MTAFDKAWSVVKELSLHERAAAEEFADPADMAGHKLRDKVPSWMGRSETGELNPRDLHELRSTAASSPFRFYDEDQIYERILEQMSEDRYQRYELQSDSLEDLRRRVMEEHPKPYSAETIGACENCGEPAEGTGMYGSSGMSVCRNCA